MRAFAILIFLVIVGSGFAASQNSDKVQTKSCKDHPKVIGTCFTVSGRLSVYNGAPTLRIWKTGTRRMLGVSEQRFQEVGYVNVPESIRTKVNFDTDLFGSFLVCPFTRSRPGEMQMVCVESGRNLQTRIRK
ncbi:MAG TPA: hypothetical protein VLB68_21920 [Pyrinomonadaceae bacterium]|nr:hypothetical protein [Pyrinomonadaceae bacterium]